MEFIIFLAILGIIAVIGDIHSYIAMKREERQRWNAV